MIFVILFTCLLTVYWFCKEKLYVPDLSFLSIGPFSPAQTSNPDIFKDEHVRRKEPETSSNSGERVQSINQSINHIWPITAIARITRQPELEIKRFRQNQARENLQTVPSAGNPRTPRSQSHDLFCVGPNWLKIQLILIYLVKADGISCFSQS